MGNVVSAVSFEECTLWHKIHALFSSIVSLTRGQLMQEYRVGLFSALPDPREQLLLGDCSFPVYIFQCQAR